MCEDYTLRNVIISSKPSLAQTRQDPSLLRVHNRQFAGAQTYVQVRGKTGVNAAIVIPFCLFFGIRHCQSTSGEKTRRYSTLQGSVQWLLQLPEEDEEVYGTVRA